MRSLPIRARVRLLVVALFVGALVTVPAGPAAASDDIPLTGFETAASMSGVTVAAPGVDTAQRSTDVATEGDSSLKFTIAGTSDSASTVFPRVWLAQGTTLPAADWSARTYLHVGVINASPVPATLYVVVRDLDGRYLQRSLPAAAYAYRAFDIRTADIAAHADLTRLQQIQVSSQRGAQTKVLYVDDVYLTDTYSDEAAEEQAAAPGIIAAMGLSGLVAADRKTSTAIESALPHSSRPADRWLRHRAGARHQQLTEAAEAVDSIGTDVDTARSLRAQLDALGWTLKRLHGQVRARTAAPGKPYGVGWADSMSLVFPRDLPCHCSFADHAQLSLARNEYESTQLVVLPYGTGARDLGVRVTSAGGLGVTVAPVGSVNLANARATVATATPWRPGVYQGWAPDPILSNRTSVDVAGDDLQAFWVRVHTTKHTAPGRHAVELAVTAAGATPIPVHLGVEVVAVTVPDTPTLHTAIGTDPAAYAEPYGVTDAAGIAALQDQENAFLARYRIQPDNIYRKVYEDAPPTVAELKKIAALPTGLQRFDVWYFDPRTFDLSAPDTWRAQADELFDHLAPYLAEYRSAGLIDKAYLYCCDETPARYFPMVKQVLTWFKQRFPDVRMLSVAVDNRMGLDNGLAPLTDSWVRDVPHFSTSVADQRHAMGLESWWYVHAGVQNPYPNVFVGLDPGPLRTLLGPLSFRAHADGFLYYRVDRWYGHSTLTDGPLSDWDPVTWGNVAGDGSLCYPGPDGPIPSQRLENLRDGLDDHDLLTALQSAVADHPQADPALLSKARDLLGVSQVATGAASFTRDPHVYRTWRTSLLHVLAALD